MTDFFGQRDKEGIKEEVIALLKDKEPIHSWTVDGCLELRVLGRPYLKDGHWKARVGRDKLSLEVAPNRSQFHRACDCIHGDRTNGLQAAEVGEGEVES